MRRSSINSVCGVVVSVFVLGVFAGCSGGGGGGDDKIDPVVCNPPFVPSSSGTLCVCPPGTHDQNQTCVPDGITDTTPPTVTLVSPTNGSTVSGTVNVVANVVDGSTIAEVALYLDNNSRSESFTESPAGTYTAQLNTTALTSGSHTVKVCAIDSHANNGCSTVVSVTASNPVPDTTPPTVTITSPANGATVSGTFALTANVTDDRGVAVVRLVVDGAQSSNTFTENPAHIFTANVDSTSLSNASHTFQACATDTSSNASCSAEATITVANSSASYWRNARPTGYTNLSAIWGSGPNDVWAGGGWDYHWDGATWTNLGQTSSFRGFWGSGPNDVWATTSYALLHWNGSTWAAPAGYFGLEPTDIWGSSSADIWVVGYDRTSNGGIIVHWNGSSWSTPTTFPSYKLNGVWGSGPNDVWAVGKNNVSAGGIILHWNGSAWSVDSTPNEEMSKVWGSGPNDVWFVSLYEGNMLHRTGTTWSTTYTPNRSINLFGLWGSGPNDVWAVGYYYSSLLGGVILHWNGSVWDIVPCEGAGKLFDIWGFGPNSIWAVGEGGIYYYGP